MDKPLVSIIINNYNYQRFLHEAIDSALSQTYINTEVIVVDDGSTDNSQETIRNYTNKIIPVLKENGGQASALNAGFLASHGEIVIFLDADDYLFPDTVEQVVAAWNPSVAKVHYYLEVVDNLGNPKGIYPPPERPLDSGNVWPILLNRGRYGTPVTSGNAFSRTVLDKIFPIPEVKFRLAADGYLVTLVPFYGPIISVEKALGAYRMHGSNLWAQSQGVEIEKFSKFIQHDLDRYELLTCKATELRDMTPQNFSYRDSFHLRMRIASLRLNYQNHPIPADSLFALMYKGILATWQYSDYKWQKRLLLSMWFIGIGLLPLSIARYAVNWQFSPQCRSKILTHTLKLLKRAFAILKFSS